MYIIGKVISGRDSNWKVIETLYSTDEEDTARQTAQALAELDGMKGLDAEYVVFDEEDSYPVQ